MDLIKQFIKYIYTYFFKDNVLYNLYLNDTVLSYSYNF